MTGEVIHASFCIRNTLACLRAGLGCWFRVVAGWKPQCGVIWCEPWARAESAPNQW